MNPIRRPVDAVWCQLVYATAASAVLFAPAVAGANAGPIAFHEKASTIGLLTYEVVVVVVEWVLLSWLFRLPWTRAFLFTLGANCVSFLVGIPFSLAVPLAVFWVFPMLPLNVVTEGLFWRLEKSAVQRPWFWGRIFAVNLLTWLLFVPLELPILGAGIYAGAAARVQSDLRSMQGGIDAYIADHGAPPPMLGYRDQFPQDLVGQLRSMGGVMLSSPHPGGGGVAGLTTPVAYTTSLFPDPNLPRGFPSSYHADGEFWLLFSPGPDRQFEISPGKDFVTSEPEKTRAVLRGKRYDPTNGLASRGDVWVSNLEGHDAAATRPATGLPRARW